VGSIKTIRGADGKPEKYIARYRNPMGKSRKKTCSTKEKARAHLAKVEADKLRGTYVESRLGRTKFGPWAEECLAGKIDLRAATKARDESLALNHVIPAFDSAPLSAITRTHVQKWIAHLTEKGLAPRTVRECYRIMGGIMAEAVESRMIPESPCRKVRLPRIDSAEKHFLGPSEIERLAEATPEGHRALIYTASFLGCRWEELAGLKRSNLNMLRRTMAIVGTIERDRGKYRYVEETKTDTSRRTLRLPSFVLEILAQHLATAPESDFVFPSAEGGFLRYDNFMPRVWAKAVQRAGLEPLTFHELRHTAAALMIDQGADPLQVQRRLGHKDVRTTLKHYGHLFPNREDDLNDALERVWAETKNQRLVSFSCPSDEEAVVSIAETSRK